ncbi:hypothetical protein [Boseongicola sp. H5]|uniref:hypothetical protein n=1 Tax=Boseongicola sp. H5 TaxID=2763261 RepID=UPI001D09CDA1|nr:hypothetical protein [Boseongicola sp. H5]
MKPVAFGLALGVLLVSAAGAETTDIADLRPGMSVTLTGTVERVTDEDEFELADGTGRVRVYVGPNPVPAAEGETLTVIGTVDDDLPLEVYATGAVLADGTEVSFPYRY